jgi:hypothetical protein
MSTNFKNTECAKYEGGRRKLYHLTIEDCPYKSTLLGGFNNEGDWVLAIAPARCQDIYREEGGKRGGVFGACFGGVDRPVERSRLILIELYCVTMNYF